MKIFCIVLLSLLAQFPSYGVEISLCMLNQKTFLEDPKIEEIIKGICLSAFESVYKDEWSADFEHYMLQFFNAHIEKFKTNNDMVLVVGTIDNKIGGWVLLYKEDEHAVIELLCIEPGYWRQGLGKKLVFSIRDSFPEITRLAVVTRKQNTISPSFYQSLGFKKTSFSLPEYNRDEMQGFEWLHCSL